MIWRPTHLEREKITFARKLRDIFACENLNGCQRNSCIAIRLKDKYAFIKKKSHIKKYDMCYRYYPTNWHRNHCT